jgi:cytochrome c-type biogenesis protein
MLYGNLSLQKNIQWKNVLSFILGKIIAFSALGLLIWLVGNEMEQRLTLYFPCLRKIVCPLFVFVGIFLLGFFKFKWTIPIMKLPKMVDPKKPFGSLLLGIGLSLAFCPTMFILFFVTLMPIVLSNSYGFVLPSIIALGTAIPLLLIILII